MAYGSFSHNVKENIHPPWKKCLTSLSKVQTTDRPKFDAQTLQEDGEDIRHQDNEQKLEAIRSTSSHVRRVISWIDVCN